MGQGICWCGGRESKAALITCELQSSDVPTPVCDELQSGELPTPASNRSVSASSAVPIRAMRNVLAAKAGLQEERFVSAKRIDRTASAAEADERWKATREAWEQQVRAALEIQVRSSGDEEVLHGRGLIPGECYDEVASIEDERRAALAMFRVEAEGAKAEKVEFVTTAASETTDTRETPAQAEGEDSDPLGGVHLEKQLSFELNGDVKIGLLRLPSAGGA